MAESSVRILFLGDASQAVRSVRQLEGGFGSLGRAATVTAGIIGVGLVGSMAAATKQAIGFDRSMRNVNSIAKLSEKQFQSLSKQVLGLAKTTGQGPKVLADGLYDIVSSGFKAADALKILHAAAIAATAGMTDVATASKAIDAVLNSYHLSADKARNVSSLLFEEVNKGVNTFAELASQIGDVSPIAAQLKIPFSDVAAALASATLNGTSLAESATQMSRVMVDLLKPSKALKAEIHALGYESGSAAIQQVGFVGLIDKLSVAAKGSGETTAEWFKNIRSLRGILNLTGPNLQRFNALAKDMARSFREGGADTAAFNEQAKSISVQWKIASAALAAASIPIGQLLFPALTKAAGALGDFAGWITKINDAPDLKAKLGVIGGGFRTLADDVQTQIDRILHGYDKVIRGEGGIGATTVHFRGLGEQIASELGQVDWGVIGQKVLAGIVSGIKGGEALGVAVVDTVSKALSTVNWANVGVKLGPALAGAIAAAFVTLTDPGFWIHHWDLALAVGLTVFGGAIGRFAGRFGLLFARMFGRLAEDAALALAERLPTAVQGVFLDAVMFAGRELRKIPGIVKGVVGDVLGFLNPFGPRVTKLLTFTLKVLGIDAAIRAVSSWAVSAAGWVSDTVKKIDGDLGGIPGKIADAFGLGPIHTFINAISTLIGWVKSLIAWLGRIHFPSIHLPSLGSLNPFKRASGGFIPGRGVGDTVPAMLTPGEVVLNRAQQDVFGGPQVFREMFHFAGGGIVPKPISSRNTSPPNRRGNIAAVRAVTAAGRAAFAAARAVQTRETDLQSAYDLLGRGLSIEQTYHPVLVTDAQGNQVVDTGELAKQLAEIDQMIASRQKMLALVDLEKRRWQEAVIVLRKAVAKLLDAIQQAREQAADDTQKITALQADIAQTTRAEQTENHDYQVATTGKKLSKGERARLKIAHDNTLYGLRLRKDGDRAKITGLRADRTGLMKNISGWQAAVGDLRHDQATAGNTLAHDIGFRRQGYALDVTDLRGMRGVLAATTGSAGPGGGGGLPTDGGAGIGAALAGGDNSALVDALNRTIAELTAQLGATRLALGIQDVQLPIIGAFQKGTIHLPQTGMYLGHAGESITPAGFPSVGKPGTSGTSRHLIEVDLGEPFNSLLQRKVLELTPEISLAIGREADDRRRGGRY